MNDKHPLKTKEGRRVICAYRELRGLSQFYCGRLAQMSAFGLPISAFAGKKAALLPPSRWQLASRGGYMAENG